MTLTKHRLGTNEDGTPAFHFVSDTPVADLHVVYTGPHAAGRHTVLDGTEYDVDELFTEVAGIRHAVELANSVAKRFAESGHPAHKLGEPFEFVPLAYPGEAFATLLGTLGGNALLSGGLAAVMTFASLHTASPGASPATGANEYSGVTRQAATWNTPASNAMTNSSSFTWSTSGASAVTHVGTGNTSATAYTAANFALGFALGSSVTAASITAAAGALTASSS